MKSVSSYREGESGGRAVLMGSRESRVSAREVLARLLRFARVDARVASHVGAMWAPF